MSLSRTPSPAPGGGWSSPGLNPNSSGRSSPTPTGNQVVWESARMKNSGGKGYPSFSTQNQGFFNRHMRRISSSLPTFTTTNSHYAEKEKLQRGRWSGQPVSLLARMRNMAGRVGRKSKMRLLLGALLFGLLLVVVLLIQSCTLSKPHVEMHIC